MGNWSIKDEEKEEDRATWFCCFSHIKLLINMTADLGQNISLSHTALQLTQSGTGCANTTPLPKKLRYCVKHK